ncbi:L-arabinose transport system permease protein AraQ [Paenibacillus allorhizoplanae]|uniref:L-arabinose transport system permease protein AraQ n=1 Tax=Paenibacillus allorhizoplanae TaxID=2905648 RepID=A0ABM9BRK2_9BACL|nr:carbohydrate ABC transporter permease [Paenibacillus allorhizoplanae]CAH1192024.1 L-arabinose transport system permease protein AraQ [Paenibacillus allorhizoplanae]
MSKPMALRNTSAVTQTWIHVIFIVVCVACLYPFLVIVATSFQSENSIVQNGYSIIPNEFNLDAYRVILVEPKQLLNSYVVTIVTTLIGTIVGLWVTTSYAFAISRHDYAYRGILAFLIFFTMLFKGGLVPSYILISKWLGLQNNILALIVPYLISGWFVLLMKGFLQALPNALFESAKMDGAGETRIFIQLVLPLSLPALATVGLFFVLQYWNDWWLTLLYVDSKDMLKLQYLLIRVLRNMEFLNSAEAIQYGLVKPGMVVPSLSARMAMCVLAAGPMLVVFPFFQRFFVRGLTVGSVKG